MSFFFFCFSHHLFLLFSSPSLHPLCFSSELHSFVWVPYSLHTLHRNGCNNGPDMVLLEGALVLKGERYGFAFSFSKSPEMSLFFPVLWNSSLSWSKYHFLKALINGLNCHAKQACLPIGHSAWFFTRAFYGCAHCFTTVVFHLTSLKGKLAFKWTCKSQLCRTKLISEQSGLRKANVS